ncbi:MAG: serine hydrolase domain-containing protein, partial [Rhodothermales bacterium]|nr:serine hydrolase domain-containing protein [Rhodothermales bacterium]
MRLLPLLLVLLPAPTLAQPAADSAAAFAAAADAFYAETLAAVGAVPGVAVAVVRGDETVYARGFGMADREAGLEATPHTPFYIASATKPFTALAAALLHHRGEIDLDAPLTQYTPGIAFDNVDAGAVTLRDLLTHTHGLENSAIGLRTAFTGEHTPEDLWALLAAT